MIKTLSYQSSIISYEITGKGRPVLLLHGFGEDKQIWEAQVTYLKDHCLLIIPDIPGSGNSTLLHEARSIDDHTHWVAAILRNENINDCTMLGHSMGGYITLAFAEKYSSRLNAFGLVHSTAYADSEEKKMNRQKSMGLIEKYGSHAFLKASIPGLFGAKFKELHAAKIEALIERSNSFSNEALLQYYRLMMQRPDRTSVLKSNPLPVLFVMGTEDTAAPMGDVLQQVHLPNKSYIHLLQGVGHMSMLENPIELNGFLHDFINR